MRISDWSSDVCSSDLAWIGVPPEHGAGAKERVRSADGGSQDPQPRPDQPRPLRRRRRIPPQHVAPALAPLLRSGRGVGVRARSSQEICHYLPSRNFSPSPDFPSPEQRRSLPVGVTQGQGMEIRQKRSEEHTSELQSLMRISYAVFCLKKTMRKI